MKVIIGSNKWSSCLLRAVASAAALSFLCDLKMLVHSTSNIIYTDILHHNSDRIRCLCEGILRYIMNFNVIMVAGSLTDDARLLYD